MNLGEWIVVWLSAFFLVWYIGLNMFNRRRGVATYQWLRRGLMEVGEITDAQWLGSSSTGGRFVIAKAKKPFRRFEAMYLLETRELLPYWIISHLRGRRDEIIIKASLRSVPKAIIEVRRVENRQFNQISSQEREHGDGQVRVVYGFSVSTYGPGGDPGENSLVELLADFGEAVQKMSLQREAPHLEIRINIKPVLSTSSETFFAKLKAWLE
jgi:hypothetical protein